MYGHETWGSRKLTRWGKEEIKKYIIYHLIFILRFRWRRRRKTSFVPANVTTRRHSYEIISDATYLPLLCLFNACLGQDTGLTWTATARATLKSGIRIFTSDFARCNSLVQQTESVPAHIVRPVSDGMLSNPSLLLHSEGPPQFLVVHRHTVGVVDRTALRPPNIYECLCHP